MKINVKRVNRALASRTQHSPNVTHQTGNTMACIDIDSLAQYETDAKQGRADALYNLGLAYSTGQGVDVDYVAAHKWFNLAAMKGSELAKSWRAQISREMISNQIAEAQ